MIIQRNRETSPTHHRRNFTECLAPKWFIFMKCFDHSEKQRNFANAPQEKLFTNTYKSFPYALTFIIRYDNCCSMTYVNWTFVLFQRNRRRHNWGYTSNKNVLFERYQWFFERLLRVGWRGRRFVWKVCMPWWHHDVAGQRPSTQWYCKGATLVHGRAYHLFCTRPFPDSGEDHVNEITANVLGARLVYRVVWPLWNLNDTLATVLLICLPNVKAIRTI